MVKILMKVNISIFKKIVFKDITLLIILLALLCGFIKKTIYVLIIVLLHEFGHVFICILFKYKIISINIYPFGGITKIDKHLNDSFFHDIFLASGGIIVQLLILLLGKINIINNPYLLDINYKILIFNLLPIIPLDGSKIVFELVNKLTSFYNSIYIYTVISFISIFLFVYFNKDNLFDNYVIIGLFVQKTIEIYHNRHLLINKFILERKLYKLKFNYIKYQNIDPIKYYKDVKYYYQLNNSVIDDYEYLNNMIK